MKMLTITGQPARIAICRHVNESPIGMVVTIREHRKSRDQEEKYHAIIGEIAKRFEFCGRFWDAEDMKRLLLDQFRRDTAAMDDLKPLWADVARVELAPSLDGCGVVALGTQSRRFPKKLASAFIDWLYAWAAQNGMELSEGVVA